MALPVDQAKVVLERIGLEAFKKGEEAIVAGSNLEAVGVVLRDMDTGRYAGQMAIKTMIDEAGNESLGEAVQQVFTILHQNASLLGERALQPLAVTMMSSNQLVNLSISAVSLTLILRRLERLSQEIAQLEAIIRSEFNRDRIIQFKRALQAARDMVEKQDGSKGTSDAIYGLYEAREQFMHDFRDYMEAPRTPVTLAQAQVAFLHAVYAEISRIRSYLIVGGPQEAISRLKEDLPQTRQAADELVKAWLGDTPVEYFYPVVSEQDLDRFLRLQHWIKGRDAALADSLFTLLNEYRGQFWDRSQLKRVESGIGGRLLERFPGERGKSGIELMSDALEQSEIVRENMQRLEGYEMEIRTERLRAEADERYRDKVGDAADDDDMAIYLTPEYAERVNRLSA